MKSYYLMSYGYISRCHVTHDDIKILMICVYKLFFDITVWASLADMTSQQFQNTVLFWLLIHNLDYFVIINWMFYERIIIDKLRIRQKTTKMEKIEPYMWFHALFIGSGKIPWGTFSFRLYIVIYLLGDHLPIFSKSEKRFRFLSSRSHSKGPKSREFYLLIGYLVAIFIFGKSSRQFPSTLTGNNPW